MNSLGPVFTGTEERVVFEESVVGKKQNSFGTLQNLTHFGGAYVEPSVEVLQIDEIFAHSLENAQNQLLLQKGVLHGDFVL